MTNKTLPLHYLSHTALVTTNKALPPDYLSHIILVTTNKVLPLDYLSHITLVTTNKVLPLHYLSHTALVTTNKFFLRIICRGSSSQLAIPHEVLFSPTPSKNLLLYPLPFVPSLAP